MKRWGTTGVLLLCLLLAGATACDTLGGGDKGETSQQLVEVVRGDLTVIVSGSGNIEASNEARLTFGSGGRIDKIHVEEGDEVGKGEVLAELDTTDLELVKTQAEVALTQAQLALTQAKVALTQAQITQQTAEYNLETTLDKKDTLELALFNAQINVKTAEYNLDKAQDTYRWPEVEESQSEVDDATSLVEYATLRLSEATTANDMTTWTSFLARAQARLDAAEAKLKAQLSSYDTEEVAIKKLQVEAAEMAEAQAQKDLDKVAKEIAIKELQVTVAKESVEQAQQSVEQAQQSVELAQQSLAQAQKQLDEATITAPFDGAVASVDAEEGDTVSTAITIIHLVDPTRMELIVEVDEIDMPEVKLNQEAIISLDALPDAEFKGGVASIYPLPTEEGGVVLYSVKINLDVPENSGLRVGMSVSADIIVDKRSDVLLVPSRAVEEDDQDNPVVRVMVNEQIQEKPVVVGISDDLQTEIVSGLMEGEVVVVGKRAK